MFKSTVFGVLLLCSHVQSVQDEPASDMEEGESLVHSLPFSDKSYQYPHHPPDPYQSPTPAPYYASTPAPYHAPTPTPYHSPSPSPYAPYAPHAPTAGPYSPMHYPLMSEHGSDTVYRNPFEIHGAKEINDAIRTQDRDKQPSPHPVVHPDPRLHPDPHPVPNYAPKVRHYAEPHHDPKALHHEAHHLPTAPHHLAATPPHHLPGSPPHHLPGAPHHVPEAPHGYAYQPQHNKLKEYRPYHYDMTKVPECAYTNKQFYNITFCLQDDYYPVDTIKHELERNRPLVDRLLSDITYQSADNLVDGLTKFEEEGYNYEHYYGKKKHQTYSDDYRGYSYSKDYYKSGGYICPSDIFYGRPKRAVNTYGKWKVIVNLPDEYYANGYGVGYEKYTQTHRLEQCMYPGAPCSFIDTAVHSSCLQKHNFVRLLSYTYEEGLHIDSFKLPVSCSCHVKPPTPHPYGYIPPPPAYGYTPKYQEKEYAHGYQPQMKGYHPEKPGHHQEINGYHPEMKGYPAATPMYGYPTPAPYKPYPSSTPPVYHPQPSPTPYTNGKK